MSRKLPALLFLIFFIYVPCFSQPVLSVIISADSSFGDENTAAVLSIVTAHVMETNAYRVISAAQREAAIKELEFSLSDLAEKESQLRIGKLLSADRILSTRCSKAGDYLVVQLSLIDVETGAAVGSALGKYRNLGTLLESMRHLVAECLGLKIDQGSDERVRFVTVENTTELLRELKSNTVITLKAGVYNLSRKNDIKHENLSWSDLHDGFYPIVKSVTNLTLRSEGDAEIVIDPAYGWVIEFQTCQNLRFQRLRFMHTKPGYCLGGVLRFQLCENVEISNCMLEGSGTYGLALDHTFNFTMSGSGVRFCTYGIMQLFDSRDVLFIDSVFEKNKQFTMITINNTSNVDFIQCRFSENDGATLVSADTSSYSIKFTRSVFAKNNVDRNFDDKQRIQCEQCVFEK